MCVCIMYVVDFKICPASWLVPCVCADMHIDVLVQNFDMGVCPYMCIYAYHMCVYACMLEYTYVYLLINDVGIGACMWEVYAYIHTHVCAYHMCVCMHD